MTKALNSLQGKTIEYAQDKQDHEKQIQSECCLPHITETSSSGGRSWPFPALSKRPPKLSIAHQETTAPVHLGKLVRAPAAPDHPSAFCLFLLHSCVQFSVLGVFKGTFILGPGFSSFMVIQLPLPEPKNV